MTDAKLENRRNDASAKCANCAHWSNRDGGLDPWGDCEATSQKFVTTDLTVCTAWKAHEIHTGRILKPDEIIQE